VSSSSPTLPDTETLPPLYARTHNELLNQLSQLEPDGLLPSLDQLRADCDASRSTIYKIIQDLEARQLVRRENRRFRRARPILQTDYLAEADYLSKRETVEHQILQLLVNGELAAGTTFSELELARRFNVATVTIREALGALQGIGVLHKEARRQWTVVRIDEKFIHDLIEVRMLVELHALDRFLRGEPSEAALAQFREILEATRALAAEPEPSAEEFFPLDEALHGAILAASGNMQLTKFHQFFHFPLQFQFRTGGPVQEAIAFGLQHHLEILEAILALDRKQALRLLKSHLLAAQKELLSRIGAGSKNGK